MKIFEYDIQYDIFDGGKGIIIAESYERARQMFEQMYPYADPDCYDYYNVEDKEKYKYGAMIAEICEYDGREKLICTM